VSAALFGVGALVAALLLPPRRRVQELWNAAMADGAEHAAAAAAGGTDRAPAAGPVPALTLAEDHAALADHAALTDGIALANDAAGPR
jgi:hypothetical protein